MTKKIFKNYISNILFVQTAPKKKKSRLLFMCNVTEKLPSPGLTDS